MKELEKTKRISIAAVLSILIVLIALIDYQKPQYVFNLNGEQTLKIVSERDYLVSTEEVDADQYLVLDIRNPYEFEKAHHEGAVNLYAPDLFNRANEEFVKNLIRENRAVLLYGKDPSETLPVYMGLVQMGMTEVYILSARINFDRNLFKTSSLDMEKESPDVTAHIQRSQEEAAKLNAERQKAVRPKPVPKPQKVTPVKKKKKRIPEGGC